MILSKFLSQARDPISHLLDIMLTVSLAQCQELSSIRLAGAQLLPSQGIPSSPGSGQPHGPGPCSAVQDSAAGGSPHGF